MEGVRGIATGSSFRRSVAETLARQFGRIVEQECAPFQFALSTRAGTDCVGHAIRAMTDLNSRATVMFDRIGANDHVLRSLNVGQIVGSSLSASSDPIRQNCMCSTHQLRVGVINMGVDTRSGSTKVESRVIP